MEKLSQLVRAALDGTSSPLSDFSEEMLASLYAIGYDFYQNGKYQESCDFFRFLTIADPYKKKHWMGAGASRQMLKQYSQALECYEIAAVQDPKDPYVHLHAADCFLALNDQKKAAVALDSAENTAHLKGDETHLISHIHLIRKAWLGKTLEGNP